MLLTKTASSMILQTAGQTTAAYLIFAELSIGTHATGFLIFFVRKGLRRESVC